MTNQFRLNFPKSQPNDIYVLQVGIFEEEKFIYLFILPQSYHLYIYIRWWWFSINEIQCNSPRCWILHVLYTGAA